MNEQKECNRIPDRSLSLIIERATYGRVEIAEGIDIAEILGRMLVTFLEATVIVVDNGIENFGEHRVRLGVRRVDTDARIVILQAGLDDVQKSGAERGLSGLELIKDFLRQVFLQQ